MTIFSKIINGEIPCYKIAEDDKFFAFLDIRPMQPGHTLVVPKVETDYIFDLTDEDLKAMIVFAKRIAVAIKTVIPCDRVAMAVIGLEVPHAHIHLAPITVMSDFGFAHPKSIPADTMKEIAEKIGAAVVIG